MRFCIAQSWQVQQAHQLCAARAVNDLFAEYTTPGSESGTVDLPAGSSFGDGLGKLVVGDPDACLLTLLLGK